MKKSWIVIIVVLVIAGGLWWFNGSSPLTSLLPQASSSPAVVVKTPAPTAIRKAVSATSTPVSTPVLSYTQLVQKYGANRIQFDTNCQAQPASVVFKNGTNILLDNRSNQTRTITINGLAYTLSSYGYKELTLSSPTLPQTLKLGCNNLVNVGTIQLQANISGQ